MQRQQHIYAVDICRFFCILMIMAHHRYILGFDGEYLFRGGWAWVEYFFMITGYFTMAHFARHEANPAKIGQEAFSYVWKKFLGFMPYIIVTVLLQYAVEGFHYVREGRLTLFFKNFINAPFEIAMISEAGFTRTDTAPLWFLSAMFLMLPFLICLMLKLRDIWMVLSFLIPIFYYGQYGLNTDRTWPNDLLRAVAAMSLGMFLYYIVGFLQKREWAKIQQVLLTLAEVLSFAAAVAYSATHNYDMNWLLVFFVVNLSIMMSGVSLTAHVKGSFFVFLGKISLPIYIIHWTVGTIALHFSSNLTVKLIIYYAATIVVSGTVVIFRAKIKRSSNSENK